MIILLYIIITVEKFRGCHQKGGVNMLRLVNLCPHTITIVDKVDNHVIVAYPSKGVARARQWESEEPPIAADGILIPSADIVFGEPVGLPEPMEGLGYIVSQQMVRSAKDHGRTVDDLFITSRLVRDADGNTIGCYSLTPGRLVR